VRSIPGLLGVLDISKCQTIKARQARDLSVYYCDGEEDGPSDEPNGEEHDSHHAKEANEEVSIQAVYTLDIFDISPPYRERPRKDILRQTRDAPPDPSR